MLGRGKLLGFPVAQALGFRYADTEHDGRELAQAFVGDAVLGRYVLQLDESARGEMPQLPEYADIVADGDSGLDDSVRGEQLQQRLFERDAVQPEQKSPFAGRELQQRHLVHHAFGERRAGLRVEADYVAFRQVRARVGDQFAAVHYDDLAGEGPRREQVDRFAGDAVGVRFFHRWPKVTD